MLSMYLRRTLSIYMHVCVCMYVGMYLHVLPPSVVWEPLNRKRLEIIKNERQPSPETGQYTQTTAMGWL